MHRSPSDSEPFGAQEERQRRAEARAEAERKREEEPRRDVCASSSDRAGTGNLHLSLSVRSGRMQKTPTII